MSRQTIPLDRSRWVGEASSVEKSRTRLVQEVLMGVNSSRFQLKVLTVVWPYFYSMGAASARFGMARMGMVKIWSQC